MDGGTTPAGAAAPVAAKRPDTGVRRINLALQGGGAHGAFTWGVLDRLLEDERIAFDGISATSAGAMNAVVMAEGLTKGGRSGAREALERFWQAVSHSSRFSPLQPSLLDRMTGNRRLETSPSFLWFDLMSRILSPYQFNPMNWNPLRDVLRNSVDFQALASPACPVKLFLSATNVRTGKIKLFENAAIDERAVLASACLPFLFQAVEIDGEHYWDGGYMGNPALFPLIYGCDSLDVLVVHINPLTRNDLPRSATDIMNRINEISFNSSLMREMRAVGFVTQLIDEGRLTGGYKRMLIHGVIAEEVMGGLGVASKLNADWSFLTWLRDIGRQRADAWIAANYDSLGRRSTIDLRSTYL